MSSEVIGLVVTVVVAHFLALLSPGPDFVLVVKSGIRGRKRNALGVALGIATANGLYIALCLIGVGALLSSSLVIMTGLKVCGGAFLCYLAVMALKTKRKDYEFLSDPLQQEVRSDPPLLKEFTTGFASAILNPKNLIFYLSLFSLILTNHVDVLFKVGLGIWMTCLVFAWDAFIIYVLSRPRVKNAFSRVSFYIDKLTGAILGLVGLKIVQSVLDDHL